jgi:hypothetical protein
VQARAGVCVRVRVVPARAGGCWCVQARVCMRVSAVVRARHLVPVLDEKARHVVLHLCTCKRVCVCVCVCACALVRACVHFLPTLELHHDVEKIMTPA